MGLYQPAEDSYLLLEVLEKYLKKIKTKNIRILDMGTGTGIQADTCKRLGFSNILTSDIDKNAVEYVRKNGFESVQSDLFKKIKKEKFDLIIFNPPYLPKDTLEPKESRLATTAGKEGYELIVEFLKQAKSYLSKTGVILLLFSSLSRPEIIKKQSKELGYKLKLQAKQKLFFEHLFVYKFEG